MSNSLISSPKTNSKVIISIKQSMIDFQYIFVKYYNDYIIQISYRSPSIYLDGIYLTVPNEIFKTAKIYNTGHKSNTTLILKATDPIISSWCALLYKINKCLHASVMQMFQKEEHQDQAKNKDSKNHKLIQYKPFIKLTKTRSGDNIYMIMINDYKLIEKRDDTSKIESTPDIPIVFYITEINRYYNNYYCRATLNYKYL